MHAMIYGAGREELHEGTGIGLDLVTEEVLAEAFAILEPAERYYELHRGTGTGLELNAIEIVREAEDILLSAWREYGTPDHSD